MTNAVVKTRPDDREEVPVDACGGYRRARVSMRPNLTAWRARHAVVDG
jgi:hypothetical protein